MHSPLCNKLLLPPEQYHHQPLCSSWVNPSRLPYQFPGVLGPGSPCQAHHAIQLCLYSAIGWGGLKRYRLLSPILNDSSLTALHVTWVLGIGRTLQVMLMCSQCWEPQKMKQVITLREQIFNLSDLQCLCLLNGFANYSGRCYKNSLERSSKEFYLRWRRYGSIMEAAGPREI